MKARGRVQSRVYIDNKTRELVSKKTKGVCSHCGCKIRIGDNFSVDHAVPLNIGGTNDIENLVPLCKDCNFHKDDKLMPIGWYKCLNKGSNNQLKTYIENFEIEHDKVGYNYFLAYDKIAFDVLSDMKNGLLVKHKRTIRKAYYSDLDQLYHIYIEYFKNFNIPFNREEIKKQLSEIFTFGAIYVNTDMSIIIPLTPYGSEYGKAQGMLFWYPIVRYTSNLLNNSFIISVFDAIISNVKNSICRKDDNIPFYVWTPAEDIEMCCCFSYAYRIFYMRLSSNKNTVVSSIPYSEDKKSYMDMFTSNNCCTISKFNKKVSVFLNESHKDALRKRSERLELTDDEIIKGLGNISENFKNTYKDVFLWDFCSIYYEELKSGITLSFLDVEAKLEYKNESLTFSSNYGTNSVSIGNEKMLEIIRNNCFCELYVFLFSEKMPYSLAIKDGNEQFEFHRTGKKLNLKEKYNIKDV